MAEIVSWVVMCGWIFVGCQSGVTGLLLLKKIQDMGDIHDLGILRIKVLSKEAMAILEQLQRLNLLEILQLDTEQIAATEAVTDAQEEALAPVSEATIRAAQQRLAKIKAQKPHEQFNWVGAIAKEEGALLHKELTTMRQEWEHRI